MPEQLRKFSPNGLFVMLRHMVPRTAGYSAVGPGLGSHFNLSVQFIFMSSLKILLSAFQRRQSPRMESATENRPPPQGGKGEKAVQETTGAGRELRPHGKPLSEQDQIGDRTGGPSGSPSRGRDLVPAWRRGEIPG